MNEYKDFQNMELSDEVVCSNFDHVINYKVVEQLKQNPNLHADYPCWDCHCKVWYDQEKQKFGCRVMQYHAVVDEIYEDTMEEIMKEVCDKYSYE